MPALRRVRPIVLVTVALLATLLPASAVQAAGPILVTTNIDEFNPGAEDTGCSLREAVQAANTDAPFGGCTAGPGTNQITLPAGIFPLSLTGANEDLNATGDLDVVGTLSIIGQGHPTINGHGTDRILEVANGGMLNLQGLTLTGGSAPSGGAILILSSNLQLNDVVVDSNAATSAGTASGGGIAVGGFYGSTVSISDSLITRNTAASTTAAWGGGIFVAAVGVLTVTNSTIASNVATDGDGLYNAGTSTIRNTTITDNGNNLIGGRGGGIYNAARTTTLESVTISGNRASNFIGDGGNIYNAGSMSAQNTLVNEALTSGNCGGTLPISMGHNLDYAASSSGPCFGSNPTDVTGMDPLLGPLQDNGGPTTTMALGAGSAAINAGITVAATPIDQRGVPRPFGSAPDIGAYERATCGGVLVNIVGTPGSDTLTGTSGPDGILGLAGNDVINGLDGNDGLCGGTGNDTLIPGPGLDSVSGGSGIDTVSYASSASGVSVDLRLPTGVATGQGRDTISGVENVIGSAYADVIRGSNANNWLSLGAGNDHAYGYGGNDRIDGGPGNDILYGLTGNDALYGGPGNDYLNGGLGRDLCRQNAGSGRRISCER